MTFKFIRYSIFMMAVMPGLAGMPAGVVAAGAPETHFYPKEGWRIKENHNSETRKKSCVLANQFNNGFFIQLNGSERGLNNISLNVRQAAFQPGSTLHTEISVPGSYRQNIRAYAFTEEEIILDLRKKQYLLKAINRANVFDLKLGNTKPMRFFMTGFSRALERFENCMGEPAAATTGRQEQEIITSKGGRALPPPEGQESTTRRTPHKKGSSYERELYHVMPEEEEHRPVPVQEKLPADLQAQNADQPTAQQDRPGRQRKRLTEMLADEMDRQYEEMREEGFYTETYKKGETISSPPLHAPLVRKGSEEEKALARIWTGKNADSPQEPAKNTQEPETQESAPASTQSGSDFSPKIRKTTKKIEADFTDLPPDPDTPDNNSYKPERRSWIEMLNEEESSTAGPGAKTRHVRVSPATTPEPRRTDSALNVKIKAMEQKIRELSEENAALESELEYALNQSRHEKTSIASENWNLEHSTKLYNEAKRQIDRLGRQIRKERAQCEAEKRELEMMLFDPQLTSEQQLAKLAILEDKLAEARRRLEEQRQVYEGRIELLEARLSGQ